MSADTEVLRADIVKALNLTPLVPPQADTETMNVVEDAWAALSGLVQLAEEVERVKERLTAYETPGWINSVQKVMEERRRAERAEARLDKALTALRDQERRWNLAATHLSLDGLRSLDRRADNATAAIRAAIAEIEGEARKVYPREMAEHFDGTEDQAQDYERLCHAKVEGEA